MYTMPYQVFVVSNQSGCSRPNIDCTESSIRKIFTKMEWELTASVNERIMAIGTPSPDLTYPWESKDTEPPTLAVHPGGIDSPMVIHESIFCPHLSEHNCACRKPKPHMIGYLAVMHGIDLGRSWIIGDSDGDIKCGYRAGIRRMIRIDHQVAPVMWENAMQVKLPKKLSAVVRVPSLLNAVGLIKAYDAYIERVWGPKVAKGVGL